MRVQIGHGHWLNFAREDPPSQLLIIIVSKRPLQSSELLAVLFANLALVADPHPRLDLLAYLTAKSGCFRPACIGVKARDLLIVESCFGKSKQERDSEVVSSAFSSLHSFSLVCVCHCLFRSLAQHCYVSD